MGVRAGALAVQKHFLPSVPWESFLVITTLGVREEHTDGPTVTLPLWELSEAEHVGEGQGLSLPSEISLPITDENIHLLLSPRGYLLTEYKCDPAPGSLRKRRNDVLGRKSNRPGRRAVFDSKKLPVGR